MKKFLVDSMLGKLAKWLRLLGYDTIYTDIKDYNKLQGFLQKDYIFLTRQHKWIHYRVLKDQAIYLVQANEPRAQLAEVMKKFKLEFSPQSFCSRCIVCNVVLVERQKEEIETYLPEYIRHTFSHFKVCPCCKRVYWSGSHQKRMQEFLKKIIS